MAMSRSLSACYIKVLHSTGQSQGHTGQCQGHTGQSQSHTGHSQGHTGQSQGHSVPATVPLYRCELIKGVN